MPNEGIGLGDAPTPIADEMRRLRLQSRLRDVSPTETENRPAGYLTEIEQARKDDISVATLRRRRAQKYGPQPVQIGRKFYYRDDATECWLAKQEAAVMAAAQPPRRGRPRK
jgi:hypothetical protein